MVMPFPYGDTLKMILEITKGMEYLHSLGFIHRDFKASIFVSPYKKDMDSFTIHHSTKVELKEDLAYDGFWVVIGDQERSDAIMGIGLWRAPKC
jgi:serine/threonine protein kinase